MCVWRSLLLGILCAAIGLIPASVMAQSGKAYFNGKTIEYLVATAAGGGHDYYGRLMARHMKPQLPGSNIIVRNVPGAGHLIGTNLIYVAKPNGLTIGTFSTGMVNTQIIGLHKGIRFDLTKMSWVGKQSTDSPALHHLTSQNRAIGSMECAGHLADVREDWLA